MQYVDAWGQRLGGTVAVSATDRNFTGHYLDDTGLLFSNARYYDPAIGRFISADSISPGTASGGMADVAYKPLTVDFHEVGFVAAVNRENQVGPWDSLSDAERQHVGLPWGPANPQALNRYSYVRNNPIQYGDPSGHLFEDDPCRKGCGGVGLPLPGPTTGAGRLPQDVVDAGTVTVGSVLLANPPQSSSQGTTVRETRSQRDSGGGWENRKTTDGRKVRVRRLGDKEVHDRGLHEEKQGRYRGKDAIYEDDEGNLYVGGRGGGLLEPEF